MVTVAQIGWSKYHDRSGPFFGGDFQTLKVPIAATTDPFPQKVLSITAAAEGGSFSSINMYDSGLISVGALQFIDAGSFGVCDMLAEVIDVCGLEPVRQALMPALAACNADFVKQPNGKWRFTLAGVPVTTTAQQKVLYFGDVSGNLTVSYNDAKSLRAKTWAACFANVWYIPGATSAQSTYSLRRLMADFIWGKLRQDMFSGYDPAFDEGWVGATRALLLAYAVNAPAVVISRYAACADHSGVKFSPEWCLNVIRSVVVDGGIDVWRARWSTKKPIVEKLFGVKLPTYAELVARKWVISSVVIPPLVADVETEVIREITTQSLPAAIDEFQRPERRVPMPVANRSNLDVGKYLKYFFGFTSIIFDVVRRFLAKR